MDWMNVSLSLVAGAPISFIQNLSQPVYARRPVVPLAQGIQISPQTYEATLEEGAPLEAKNEEDAAAGLDLGLAPAGKNRCGGLS